MKMLGRVLLCLSVVSCFAGMVFVSTETSDLSGMTFEDAKRSALGDIGLVIVQELGTVTLSDANRLSRGCERDDVRGVDVWGETLTDQSWSGPCPTSSLADRTVSSRYSAVAQGMLPARCELRAGDRVPIRLCCRTRTGLSKVEQAVDWTCQIRIVSQ